MPFDPSFKDKFELCQCTVNLSGDLIGLHPILIVQLNIELDHSFFIECKGLYMLGRIDYIWNGLVILEVIGWFQHFRGVRFLQQLKIFLEGFCDRRQEFLNIDKSIFEILNDLFVVNIIRGDIPNCIDTDELCPEHDEILDTLLMEPHKARVQC